MNKRKRRALFNFLKFLPREMLWKLHCWMRGRHETKRLQRADVVIVSYAKSGRTWLRIMISRFFQKKFGLPEGKIIAFSNFHKKNNKIPRILFTHDYYIRRFTGNLDSKKDFYKKKVILLTRDPRDVATSSFFQWKHRINEEKKKLNPLVSEKEDITLFEFVTDPKASIEICIQFLNGWVEEMPQIRHAIIVRYEDLRRNPEQELRRLIEFIGMPAAPDEVAEAVAYASFENMKRMERGGQLASDGHRFGSGRSTDGDAFKVRRAKVGGYRDYYTEEQAAYLDDLIQTRLTPKLGYDGVVGDESSGHTITGKAVSS